MEEHAKWLTLFVNQHLGNVAIALLHALHIQPSHPDMPIPEHVVMSLVVFAVAAVLTLWLRPQLSVDNPGGAQQIAELLITNPVGFGIRDVLVENAHDKKGKYVAMVGSVRRSPPARHGVIRSPPNTRNRRRVQLPSRPRNCGESIEGPGERRLRAQRGLSPWPRWTTTSARTPRSTAYQSVARRVRIVAAEAPALSSPPPAPRSSPTIPPSCTPSPPGRNESAPATVVSA